MKPAFCGYLLGLIVGASIVFYASHPCPIPPPQPCTGQWEAKPEPTPTFEELEKAAAKKFGLNPPM